MLSEEIVSAILDFNIEMSEVEDFQAIVPCYVGHTGTGKTTRHVQEARKRELAMFRKLLQTELPEETLGLPRVIDGVTVWSDTQWARELHKRPGILYFDEMDKPRTESLSSVLTIMAEKRVRDIVLHPKTCIVAAMQPVSSAEWLSDQTGQALSARMCFIPVVQGWEFLGNKFGLDLSFLKKDASVELPILPNPSPRQVEWFVNFCRHNPNKLELWNRVAEGMFPKDVGDALTETMRVSVPNGGVTREDLVDLLKKDGVACINKLTIPELVLLAPDTFQHGNVETLKRSYVRVWTEGNEEAAKDYLRRQHDELLARVKANGGKLEVCAGASQKEVQKCIEEAAYIIGHDHWAKNGEKAQDGGKPAKKGK